MSEPYEFPTKRAKLIMGKSNVVVEGSTILVNKLMTPDGTILTSRYRHDYVEYTDDNGKYYMVDGGTHYIRRSCNGDEKDLSVYSDDSHTTIRDVWSWGTYGKNGDEELHQVLLKDMSNAHIKAILDTQDHITDVIRALFINEQSYREYKDNDVMGFEEWREIVNTIKSNNKKSKGTSRIDIIGQNGNDGKHYKGGDNE